MKSVRIWYRKEGAAKYMSHLDLVRVMGRVFHRAGIPLWYTEGFNPHPFMTFALPLSLGTVGLRETMDIKLEDEISREAILEKMNPCMPDGITVFDVTAPVMKPGGPWRYGAGSHRLWAIPYRAFLRGNNPGGPFRDGKGPA